ncbi:recombinase XerD [Sphingomonas sp. XXL09]|uniref:recombinase XerD n=1 Tax=Sphingomonas sp. XXL09 TaxID=3457787 RepID=UPI00406BB2AB
MIAFLTEVFKQQWLAHDDDARWSVGEYYTAAVEEGLDWELSDFKGWRAEGDLDAIKERWSAEAARLIKQHDLIVAPDDLDGVEWLCRGLNDAAIEVADVLRDRLRGENRPTPPQPVYKPQEGASARRGGSVAREPLLALYDAYAAANEGMTAGVRVEWRSYIEKLIEFLGHDDAARLTSEDLRRWRDKLLSEPTKRGGLRRPVTVRDKYIGPVRSTLNFAVDEGRLAENVAIAVKVKQPKRVKLREASFKPHEAVAILRAALLPPPARMSLEHARARRWVPWLCAYTGARVGEIAQLRGADVFEEEGVWCLRITPEAGQVKTKEARMVPVHSHLIDQGFLDEVGAAGAGPLFIDHARQRVLADGNRHVKKVGERLAKWVREEVGVNDPDLQPNHAWRHLFKTISHDAQIEERMADAIQGHAPATAGRGYGAPSIKAKAAAIERFPRFEVTA